MSTDNTDNADELSDELARKYDPERLLRMVAKRAGRGEQLDQSIRAKYEKRFGVDLGHVRIYTGEFAEEFNRQRSAHAVTIGSTGMILMGGSTDKSPGTAAGAALLAHELTHVAQAKAGLHNKSTGDMPFTEEHEAEAEAVESAVEQSGGSHDHAADTNAGANAASAQQAAKEQLSQLVDAIKARVLQMAGEAVRTQIMRAGVQRRP